MTRAVLNMFGMLAALAASLAPLPGHAHALDDQLDCKSTGHAFISTLLNDQYIDPKPMRVEANSVNVFRPVRGSTLTAFGYRVYAVLGYQHNDEMFKQGTGQPVADSAYGVVIFGPLEAVQTRAHEAGSDAVVKSVVPLLLTAVFCSGSAE